VITITPLVSVEVSGVGFQVSAGCQIDHRLLILEFRCKDCCRRAVRGRFRVSVVRASVSIYLTSDTRYQKTELILGGTDHL
jgi:hypothetical protein